MAAVFDPIQIFREEQAEAREDAAIAEQEHQAAQLKERARAAYLASGGDERGFREDWPRLHRELLREETIKKLRAK
jgi:hypothetical protein